MRSFSLTQIQTHAQTFFRVLRTEVFEYHEFTNGKNQIKLNKLPYAIKMQILVLTV
jgi:hypothetical protein